MPSCFLCMGALKSPASIPCGHVFCHDCILRNVKATKPVITQHQCPVCHKPYTIVNVDPKLIPDRLKLHMLPSIRTLHLGPSTIHDVEPDGRTRDTAEIMSLRSQRDVMQWRAGVHAATISGLTCLAKMARDQAIQMRNERDSLERKYNALKRKVSDEDECSSCGSDTDEDDRSELPASPNTVQRLPGRRSTEPERSLSPKRMKSDDVPSIPGLLPSQEPPSLAATRPSLEGH